VWQFGAVEIASEQLLHPAAVITEAQRKLLERPDILDIMDEMSKPVSTPRPRERPQRRVADEPHS